MAALLLSVMLAGAGCGAGGGDAKSDAGGKGVAQDAEEGVAKGGSDAASGVTDESRAEGGKKAQNPKLAQHIIRTATLRVRVESVPTALDKVRTAAADAGGIVGSETTDRDGKGHERSRIVLRVPQEQYADVLEALAGTGRQLERSEKAQDVTEQVVDVDSRIKTQKASVARIRELMDRATKISDVVTLEGELSTRQADLESLLAQQASLKDRTSLATITLHLTETGEKPEKKDDSDPGFLDALSGGWNALVNVVKWILIVLAAIAPWAAAAVVLYVLWRLLPRRARTAVFGGGAGTSRRTGGQRPARPWHAAGERSASPDPGPAGDPGSASDPGPAGAPERPSEPDA
ncbi:DUF4349 domain-containing protein [Streptomyces sp. NPDC050418]|uniref:DUF4349 domain-containing protein n=1 Tax=Streptomyces sp. NPDC050418 TaxID=3365612 RepID=UPI0037BE1112